MRLYYYTHFDYGLDDILNHHIKVATLDSVNDPYEWVPYSNIVDDDFSRQWWHSYYGNRIGFLCLCEDAKNPVMWSHYGEKHCGIVLGFDCDPEFFKPVVYSKERVCWDGLEDLDRVSQRKLFTSFIFQKYEDWAYEREHRGFFSLKDQCCCRALDGKLRFFIGLNEFATLKEVIIGCDAANRVDEVRNAFCFGKWAGSELPEIKVAELSQNYRMEILGYDEWQQKRFWCEASGIKRGKALAEAWVGVGRIDQVTE
jgi:hypothetical protein